MSQVTPFMVVDRAIYALNEQEYNHVYASFMGGGPEAATEAELKEYARRAAAALNACEGVPTETLEAMGGGSVYLMRSVLMAIRLQCQDHADEFSRRVYQLAEEALKVQESEVSDVTP